MYLYRLLRTLPLLTAVSVLLCLTLPCFSASSLVAGKVYSHNENSHMMIALTFDDGPHPKHTPVILDILRKYGVKATFFVVGENAEYYPSALLRCASEGHEIANHTYSHKNLSRDTYEDICLEVAMADDAIYDRIGTGTKLLRPPGGAYGEPVLRAAENLDYSLVLWTVDTRDWEHLSSSAIAEKVLSSVKPGDIILMHDYIAGNSPTPAALETVIPELLRRGYSFVTVSELLLSD